MKRNGKGNKRQASSKIRWPGRPRSCDRTPGTNGCLSWLKRLTPRCTNCRAPQILTAKLKALAEDWGGRGR